MRRDGARSRLREHDWRLQRLEPPSPGSRPRVVIDTDAANEIDDQFALAWALLARDAMRVEALYAAPFSFAHRHADTPHLSRELAPFNPPDVGMRRSLAEIVRVCAACGVGDMPVLAGTAGYLPADGAPPPSDAVNDLITRALAMPADEPLYVMALGCPTNISAALLIEPRIAERIVVVWTSAFPSSARQPNRSFNFEQDLRATRHLFECGVPLVYLPGYHVGAQLRLSWPEVERWVQPCGTIGALLAELYTHNPLWPLVGVAGLFAHSWVIWDLICVAWVLQPEWVPSDIVPTPGLDDALRWVGDPAGVAMREAWGVKRDAIFRDLFERLAQAAGGGISNATV